MSFAAIRSAFDPLVRLLLLAIILASIVPVVGEGRAIARYLTDFGIFLLFLINGLRLPRSDVLKGLRNMRFLLPIIIWCFPIMGFAGWQFYQISENLLPLPIALGFLFLGLLPSTVQSATAYCSLAGGNVSTSVVAAAVLNMLGVIISAPLFAWLAGSSAIEIDLSGIQRIALILIFPFVLGQILQGRLGQWVQERRTMVGWADKAVIGFAVYVAFSGAVEQGFWTLIGLTQWAYLLGFVSLYLVIGFWGSWIFAGLLQLDRPTRISFLFAGGQKSIAIGAPLATVLFAPELAGLLMLPLLIYHLVQLIISAPIARHFTQPTE